MHSYSATILQPPEYYRHTTQREDQFFRSAQPVSSITVGYDETIDDGAGIEGVAAIGALVDELVVDAETIEDVLVNAEVEVEVEVEKPPGTVDTVERKSGQSPTSGQQPGEPSV
ncbi:hypothetical protein B0A48_10432 [Cryoendolithus antarcticus]|uniref:Uncharacterized protein n=1 Tax=Cryoendolithus antarcticus TaxID=1507870 RepID=A0A1V8SY06_9PEZI|nr:hypothetical protein B0A48_10432 [Cryoendolithus antarcticus]